ncbi:NAD(P)-dependent oxidoreductase [Acidiphilium multivorum]|uniref:NAD(P)-dependent oxidoreductase n=1 Tax=Acidiphilium multivorum TaxID=62140 RepID=UPI001B8D0A93|nr:NAD(P)-dependent oxidoreductase [Acidiphilium multivorum]MBS3022836.1 NAD(P)-dependent oxidoreductase [Acidiphilium multivorum]
MTAIGLIGAGVMGGAIARRLLAAGFSLRVHDRNPPKLAALAALGALPAATPAEAARGCPFVILSLNDAAGIRAVTFGVGGIAAAAGPETLVIDMSSIDPVATRALAGRLTVMAGGTSADFESARAVMDHLAARFTLMGGTGAGQAAKLVNQLLCGAGFAALAEAIALAEAAGVDAARLPEALAGGRADSAILREFGAKFAARDETPTGRLDNMVKDLAGAAALAAEAGLALPLLEAALATHRARVAEGLGAADTAALMRAFPRDEGSPP